MAKSHPLECRQIKRYKLFQYTFLTKCIQIRNISPFLIKAFRPSWKFIKSVALIGIPTAVIQICLSVAASLTNIAAASLPQSDEIIAAYGVVQRLVLIGCYVIMGFMQGYQPVASYAFGARDEDRFHQSVRFALKGALLLTILVEAVYILLDEQDISRLYGVQAAMITVDALGGEQFDASVTQIAGTGENSGGSSKFTVELTLEKSGEMLPGMTASAFITVDTASNVPCVPVAALDQDGTKTIVYTSCDETGSTLGTPVAVTTGASDGEYVQIVEGLSEGQTCYYAYYDTLAESNAPKQSGISFRLPKRW